jgi:hypothetical protein
MKSQVPADLLSLQTWFASIITRALNKNNRMLFLSPSGRPMSEEAAELICPSQKLKPDQRIEIYNQQYWWRLLSILHKNFPALTRLFGYTDFNQSIGIPFLLAHPPTDWSLAKLGNPLVDWLKKHYTAADQPLVLHTAELDWAYQEVFFAPQPLSLFVEIDLISKQLMLQKHVRLFKLPFHLFSFRDALLEKDVEFWTEADFPSLPKGHIYFFVLYRNEQNTVCYREIQEGEWTLLNNISNGLTLQESCDYVEKEGKIAAEQAAVSIIQWTQEWIRKKWLCQK